MNTEEQMRADFEALYVPQHAQSWRNKNGTYKLVSAQYAWEVWQAACAQKTVTPTISDAQAETIMMNLYTHIAKAAEFRTSPSMSGYMIRFILNAVKELK